MHQPAGDDDVYPSVYRYLLSHINDIGKVQLLIVPPGFDAWGGYKDNIPPPWELE